MSTDTTTTTARREEPQTSDKAQPSVVPIGDMGGRHITDTSLAEQRRRISLVNRYRDFISSLPSRGAACAAMKAAGYSENRTSLDRYLAAYETGGDDALIPAWGNCGRDPKCALTEQEALILRGIILARSTGRTLHFSLAVEEFRHHPACLPLTRMYIEGELDRAAQRRRLPSWPPYWRKAAYPTVQEVAKFHGPKHSINVETVDRRGMFYIHDSGARIELRPHTIWEMDDASDNAPRVMIDPTTGKTTLTRQTLWTQDLYSAALLGFTQVARERDAYRIEDVADHVADSIRANGTPEMLRLEQGAIWNGRFFHGFVPKDVAGWPEDEKWGGLDPIIKVVNVHKSKGKGAIENSFNLLQAMLAHAALDIGRERGDFEDATKALTRAHRTGEPDARFWDLTRSAEYTAKIAGWFNTRPKQRHAFGKDLVTPNDLLRGARGRAMPDDQWWRLCPVKREATVRGDHVEISVDHYPNAFRFRVNGIHQGLHLDHGYRVLVAFHPGKLDAGCHIFNAELGARNRDGFRRAEFVMVAPVSTLKPQVDLSGRADFGPRKAANAAVTRSYRSIAQAFQTVHRQTGSGLVLRGTAGTPTTTEPTGPTPDAPQAAGGPAPALRLAPRVPVNPEQSASRSMTPCTQDEFAAQREKQKRRAAAMQETTEV